MQLLKPADRVWVVIEGVVTAMAEQLLQNIIAYDLICYLLFLLSLFLC